jgi:hypothetical protein
MIETIGARVDSAPAARVLIVTITDGEENASRRYELEQFRTAIEYRQNACGWCFILISPKTASFAFKRGIPVTNHGRNGRGCSTVLPPIRFQTLIEQTEAMLDGAQGENYDALHAEMMDFQAPPTTTQISNPEPAQALNQRKGGE